MQKSVKVGDRRVVIALERDAHAGMFVVRRDGVAVARHFVEAAARTSFGDEVARAIASKKRVGSLSRRGRTGDRLGLVEAAKLVLGGRYRMMDWDEVRLAGAKRAR